MRPVAGAMHATVGIDTKNGNVCNLWILLVVIRWRNHTVAGIGGKSVVRKPVHNNIYRPLKKDKIKYAIRIKSGKKAGFIFLNPA